MQYTPEKYYELFDKLNKGEISVTYWQDFCSAYLAQIMVEHKDVFERLKDR